MPTVVFLSHSTATVPLNYSCCLTQVVTMSTGTLIGSYSFDL